MRSFKNVATACARCKMHRSRSWACADGVGVDLRLILLAPLLRRVPLWRRGQCTIVVATTPPTVACLPLWPATMRRTPLGGTWPTRQWVRRHNSGAIVGAWRTEMRTWHRRCAAIRCTEAASRVKWCWVAAFFVRGANARPLLVGPVSRERSARCFVHLRERPTWPRGAPTTPMYDGTTAFFATTRRSGDGTVGCRLETTW